MSESSTDRSQVEQKAMELASYAATCLIENQPAWMKGLESKINGFLESVKDPCRVKTNGKYFWTEKIE